MRGRRKERGKNRGIMAAATADGVCVSVPVCASINLVVHLNFNV